MNLLKWLRGCYRRIKFYITEAIVKIYPQFIGYISGAETLPPPLSAAEESVLLKKLESGDTSVQRTLIERNLRLVVYIARKFDNTGIPIDDLVSIGSIGLIKAVNTFDVTKRIKLATYASRCIENEILMLLRRNNKRRYEISLDEPLNVDWDGNELLLSDVLVGTEGDLVYKNLENEVDLKLLEQALTSLKLRERIIIELRYGINRVNCATQKEVADQLGISQSYVSRLEKRIIKRLKHEMEKIS